MLPIWNAIVGSVQDDFIRDAEAGHALACPRIDEAFPFLNVPRWRGSADLVFGETWWLHRSKDRHIIERIYRNSDRGCLA